MPRGVFRLRISTCDAYPRIRTETATAIEAVMPGRAVGRVRCEGCTEVTSHSKHWPCLFPQHGAGPKHLRPIRLEPWQAAIALDQHPALLIRGLIHSDGCRCINRITRRLPSGERHYQYVRYFFKNESGDIRNLMIEACARLGVDIRPNGRNSLSVARKESVAILEECVGPKR